MTNDVADAGADGFRAALLARNTPSTTVGDVVVHNLDIVTGALAGHTVRVGVGVDELAPWPVNPPHWIHLPPEINFAVTNAQASQVEGWIKHSRQIDAWGRVADPMTEWLAHVRRALGDAI